RGRPSRRRNGHSWAILGFDRGKGCGEINTTWAWIEAAWIFEGKTAPVCAAEADPLTKKAELSGAFQHGCELPLRDRTSELLRTMRSLNQLV
ncbi:hypothetical protein LZ190_19740, partial [Rhodovulum sulfidophilum]|nr:hypothetical protein [Rhodovulum sulfidophilum]